MEEIIKYLNYNEYKSALDTEMQKAAESFVNIGYLLNLAEETDILKESGYTNVNEFAWEEYKLEKSQVSRFINIYERFGEKGHARLQEQYRGYGVAKLGLMLTLPDKINEELSADYSKSELQTIKTEIDEEKKISDLEVMMEEKDEVQQALEDDMQKILYQLLHDEPELYVQMYKAGTMEELQEVMAPGGECTYSVRIAGTGRMLLFIRSVREPVTISNVRTSEKEDYTWQQFWETFQQHYVLITDVKENWAMIFGEDYPIKEQPKPQTSEQPEKEEKKKESKVKVVKQQKKEKIAPVQQPEESMQQAETNMQQSTEVEVQQVTEQKQETEEQLPGQMEVQDYPELIPESMKQELPVNPPIETPKNVENTLCDTESEVIEGEVIESEVSDSKEEIEEAMKKLVEFVQTEQWENVMIVAERIRWRAAQIVKAERAGGTK